MKSVDSNYNSQFIQIDFKLLNDPAFLRFVTKAEFATYLVLRRFVWRGGEHRLGLHELYSREHKLASAIGAKRIAELLGLKDVTRVSKHLSYLEEVGVVRRIRTGRESIFVLGEWHRPDGWHVSKEFYYLDNAFGVDNSELAENAKSELAPATAESWRKEPSNNKEDNREENTVNGDHSPLLQLPDLDQPGEQTTYISQEILEQLGDRHSRRFYELVAAKVPEQIIRQSLAEIRVDGARDPARVFTYRMNQYALQQLKRGIGQSGLDPAA